jgi:hypothetical protein
LPLSFLVFFSGFGTGPGNLQLIVGKIIDVFTINENLVTLLLAVILYSNRFFHPGSTLLFPNLADFKSRPFMLRYVLLLQETKNWGVRLASGPSWGRAIVRRILDIVFY